MTDRSTVRTATPARPARRPPPSARGPAWNGAVPSGRAPGIAAQRASQASVRAARMRLRAANEGGDETPRPTSRPARRRPSARIQAADAMPAAPVPKGAARLLARTTDDRMLVGVFWMMLAIAAVVLTLDLRQMREDAPTLPGASPALPMRLMPEIALPRVGPVQLPSIRLPGTGSPPPNELRTDPDALREPLTASLVRGGTLLLRGAIDVGSAGRVAAELDARGEYVALVSLDSPGGSVADALAIAAMLRERGLPVRVEAGALCASSCPLALAGGMVREVSRQANVGVHQIFAAEDIVTDGMARAQQTTARIGRHLAAMGVDGALWLHAMETPKDRLYYLTPDELTGYNLATVLIDAPGA